MFAQVFHLLRLVSNSLFTNHLLISFSPLRKSKPSSYSFFTTRYGFRLQFICNAPAFPTSVSLNSGIRALTLKIVIFGPVTPGQVWHFSHHLTYWNSPISQHSPYLKF
ncbi:hypothetical protein L6164_034753 [Bauhinia variegata]|uniref:Uncharacterized protein n=1 Tax=Bauhinia variegata TaxID=167791 RepID=A0ACB9KWJ5_BAUVA|nr:hypothetical protein L6164_034753 [Bauhinia variegata]